MNPKSLLAGLTSFVTAYCLYLTAFSQFALYSPVAAAQVNASSCTNGLSQTQIDRLYEIGVQENRIAEMCADPALNPTELDKLITPVQAPTVEEINQCISDATALFEEFDDLIGNGFDVARDASTFEEQCADILGPPAPSPAELANCVARATQLASDSQALRNQGVTFAGNANTVVTQCNNLRTNGSGSYGFPDSIVKRLLDNNKASELLATDLEQAYKDFQETGKMPDGFTPYYPEEIEALKMLGLTDEDLQYMPPRNFEEAAEDFAANEIEKGVNEAVPLGTGMGMTVLLILGWALASPFHLIGCASRISVWTYIGGSVIYLAGEGIIATQYKDLVDRIQLMMNEGEDSVNVTIDDVTALIDSGGTLADDGKALSEEVMSLYNTCKDLVGTAPDAAEDIADETQGCLDGIATGSGPDDAERQDCIDNVEQDYDALALDIHDCMTKAQAAGVSAQELKDKGLAFLENAQKVGEGAVNQLKLLKYVRDTMQMITDIIAQRGWNVFAYGIILTAAATLAALEAAEVVTLGACLGSNDEPVNEPYHDFEAPQENIASAPYTPLEPNRDENSFMNFILASAQAQESGEKEYKKISDVEIEDKIDKLIHKDVWSLVIGLSVGFVVAIVVQILIGVTSGKTSGIIRSVFMGLGAATAIVAFGLLISASNLMQSYTDKVSTIIDAMERFMNTQGFFDDGKEWSGAGERVLDDNGNPVEAPLNPETSWIETRDIIDKFVALGNSLFPLGDAIAVGNQGGMCLSSASHKGINVDKDCSCAKKGGCAKLKIPTDVKIPQGFPASGIKNTMATIKDFNKFSQYMANGDQNASMGMIKRMTDRKDVLMKEQNFARNALNKTLKQNKKSPQNSNKLHEKMKKKIEGRVSKTFDKFPAKAKADFNKQFDAYTRPPAAASNIVKSNANKHSPTIKKLKDFLASLGPLGARKITGKQSKRTERPGLMAKAGINKGKKLSLGAPNSPQTPNFDHLDDFQVKDQDVNKDPSRSLFDIIHLRYQRSSLNQ